jgi:hypothetical protein
MNDSDKAIYEAQWSSKSVRLTDWYKVLHNLKKELQTVNREFPHLKNANYLRFISNCSDRLHDSIAGTIYSPVRDKYIDHFEYIAGH